MLEVRLSVEDVTAVARGETTVGSIRLTDHHLVFSTPGQKDHAPGKSIQERPREIWVAYPMLANCEFKPTAPVSRREPCIRIRGRDFYCICLHFPDNKIAQDIFNLVKQRSCRLGSIEKLHAFDYKPSSRERVIGGWNIYNAREEFRRQGVSEKQYEKGWKFTEINDNYQFSPTYPSVLVVPSKMSDATLKHASNHRTRCRIPTLTYLHPVNNCSITRSSQPRVGITGNRNPQDEALVAACFEQKFPAGFQPTTKTEADPAATDAESLGQLGDGSSNPKDASEPKVLTADEAIFDDKGKRLIFGAQQHNLIIDARPAINSMAMQVVGKGSEDMANYKCASKAFLNIQNIHVMRKSLNKVIAALKDGDISAAPPNPELLVRSDWLSHIKCVLDGSAMIARQVGIQHSHVLIHCSDGWDRTSQLSALSQLMLDPYFRTLKGFIVLVEKDWLSFGHMFHQRSGFLSSEQWFTVQNDAMAGTRIEPGEGERPSEVIENAMENAKRFFRQALSAEKDREDSDPDTLAAETEAAPVIEDQATKTKEISPVFHQFLDAVYQLLRQHPNRFEFNERFLRRLFYHSYSCQYGTFLLNNEKQRKEARLHERTVSVWDHFLARREAFVNPNYEPEVDDFVKGKERLIFPLLDDLRWWHQLFGRSNEEMNGPLEAAAAAKVKVAQAVQSATASPPTFQSPPESSSETPSPMFVQHNSFNAPTFGSTVLAGVEVNPTALFGSDEANSAASVNTIGKNLSSISLGGLNDTRKSARSPHGNGVDQEMTPVSATKGVAP
ncbi:protein-tyrosine phosphatase-like protein [Coniella lustricola]|uniref:Protein-tyrosine phosphatase-like protein n=1 Tax=Coniella lustricola TaxID=2025994 RepID=A0A2T3ANB0_9PEZI|nr:protein-tyrosine phosphatase-like protein [Coniella lustricola]